MAVNQTGADELGTCVSTTRQKCQEQAAQSDHSELGFFANFRAKLTSLGRKNTRSQGVIDHIDQVDLMDLAADLGCISAEEQSFTFKPVSSSNERACYERGDIQKS